MVLYSYCEEKTNFIENPPPFPEEINLLFFQKEQQQQYTYIRFPRKKMELSSEYRHCHTGKKIGGSKTHVEQNTLNDLNLAAILLLVRVTMKFHLEKLDL